MSKRKLSREELEAQLSDHRDFIRASAAAFDAGAISEAKRIAVSIRVLLHHTAKSHSILGQLASRSGTWLAYSFPHSPKNLLSHMGLVSVSVRTSIEEATGTFQALLGDIPGGPRPLKFSDWWERDIVLTDDQGHSYTRIRLVLHAANKDGGAHVDPDLDLSFEKLKNGSGIGVSLGDQSTQQPLTDVVAHSIRQIAFEVLDHLK